MEAGTPLAPIARGGSDGAVVCGPSRAKWTLSDALLDAKADINAVDSDGNNALVLAILNSHYDLAQFLIDRGADPNIAAKNGRTALCIRRSNMHDVDWSPRPARKETDKTTSMDIIRSLVDHKANVNAQPEGRGAHLRSSPRIWASQTAGRGRDAIHARCPQRRRRTDALSARHGADPKLAKQGRSDGADGGGRRRLGRPYPRHRSRSAGGREAVLVRSVWM